MDSNTDSYRFVFRVSVLFSVSFPFIIAFHIAAMLATGWGTQGFAWMAIGATWIPAALAISYDWYRLRSLRKAVAPGALTGIVTTLLFFITATVLIVLMGPMDGGI